MVQQHLLPAAKLLVPPYAEERAHSHAHLLPLLGFLGAISVSCGCQAVTSDCFGPHVQAERCGLVATSDDSCVFGITAARREPV